MATTAVVGAATSTGSRPRSDERCTALPPSTGLRCRVCMATCRRVLLSGARARPAIRTLCVCVLVWAADVWPTPLFPDADARTRRPVWWPHEQLARVNLAL